MTLVIDQRVTERCQSFGLWLNLLEAVGLLLKCSVYVCFSQTRLRTTKLVQFPGSSYSDGLLLFFIHCW